MPERLSNLGYVGVIKEVTKGTALTPTDYLQAYDETLTTNGNFVDQQPIFGNKFETYTTLQGQRSHKGDMTLVAEPNTTARLADMLFTKISTTGAGPYTHVFGLTGNANSYTVDISSGSVVRRYYGVEASSLSPDWNDNEMRWKVSVSALGSFVGREIATVSTNTITLKTDYDPAPNKGLVASDLVRLYKQSTGATTDTTVTTVNPDGITVVLGASAAAYAAGDMIYLRPATPAFTLLPTFLWARTEFRPGATAAAALSAAQLRVEQGSSFELTHGFNNEDGEARSGGFDPASLARVTGNASLDIKRFFDNVDDVTLFNNLAKSAWVLRHFSGPTSQYEARVTFNNVKTDSPMPTLKAGELQFSELSYHPNYDTTDSQAILFTVINNLATI